MFCQMTGWCGSVFVVGFVTCSAWGGHIPGHQDSDPVFPMPIPGREFFDGGALFVSAIGPVEGTIITNTQFDITYVSDGMTPASDIAIDVFVPVDGQFREVHITGADLGFGGGPGTFTGMFETDELSGEVWTFPDFSQSIIEIRIDSVAGAIEGVGFFRDSFINMNVTPVPEPSTLGLLTLGIGGLVRRRCLTARQRSVIFDCLFS